MLIYIMGRGHSGSTILDIIPGNSAQLESVGEPMAGLSRGSEGEICACGEPIQDCAHWREVHLAFAQVAGQRLGALQDWHATNPRLLLANDARPQLSFECARPLTGRFCQGLTGRP